MNTRNLVVFLVVALAAGTGRAQVIGNRWASHMAPLRAGQVELMGGVGGGLHHDPGTLTSSPFPSLVVGARWSIIDKLQVAFPLVATVSTDVDDGWPRLSASAGLVGAGYSSVEGIILDSILGAAAHWIGEKQAVVLSIDVLNRFTSESDTQFTSIGGVGGLGLKIDDAWSVGFSAGMSMSVLSASEFSRQTLRAQLGSSGGRVPADVPAVRWLLNQHVSLELWPYIGFASITEGNTTATGFADAGANASVTWRM